MFININQIGAKGLLLEDNIQMDGGLLLEDDSYFAEPLDYSVHFSREQEKIRARGRIRTTLSIHCVCCLESFPMNIDSKFDMILFPVEKIDVGHSALKQEEMEYIFYEGDQLDLGKILMEQINLFLPYNPTCSETCKGICPNCGTNLNNEECHCENTFKETELNLFSKIKR